MIPPGLTSLELARESYRGITLYAPDRAPCAVDLSDNTNLWGIPPGAERAIREAAVSAVTRYPSLYAGGLKESLARYLGVAPAMVVTGCGSDDVLDSAIRAFGEPGDRIAHPEPSFAMIPIFARMNGLEPLGVPLFDPEATLATGARIIYLCSPNNPTGNAMSRSAIEYVVERATGVVILDEAYAEFAGVSGVDLLERSERLLVTRTMSKAFGLAGLRIGYAAGSAALVAEVEKSRGPYKVSALAERAAMAALAEGADGLGWVRAHVAEAVAIRERFAGELAALGLAALPSDANFLLVPVPDAAGIARHLREGGVAVRPFVALPGVGDALRISVGPWAMMERCLAALADALRTTPA
ncbi:MAG: histidinol-phosphate transaminase [Gemmatimonadaceae bacterium]